MHSSASLSLASRFPSRFRSKPHLLAVLCLLCTFGDILRLTVPGQPQYELVPTRGLAFDVKGLPGFSIEFQKSASGKISDAVFNQPNGVFHATRK